MQKKITICKRKNRMTKSRSTRKSYFVPIKQYYNIKLYYTQERTIGQITLIVSKVFERERNNITNNEIYIYAIGGGPPAERWLLSPTTGHRLRRRTAALLLLLLFCSNISRTQSDRRPRRLPRDTHSHESVVSFLGESVFVT